jgi:hypothetical protein
MIDPTLWKIITDALHIKLYMYHVLIFDPADVYVQSHDAASN